MVMTLPPHSAAQTEALRQFLVAPVGESAMADYLFLEAWEHDPSDNTGVNLRVGQIRRANPVLAAAIRAEIISARAALRASAPAWNINNS